MTETYVPLRFMNAVEQRDPLFTHKLETELPEYVEIEKLIDDEKILVLIPYADEEHITRWEKSLKVLPGSSNLEERRRYLITLITTKLKPSTKTIEDMSYSFTGRHADVFMVTPTKYQLGAYISSDATASDDISAYRWADGNRVRNITSMRLPYDDYGIIKDVHTYFQEPKDPQAIYKVYDEVVSKGHAWVIGNLIIDSVEEILTIEGPMLSVLANGREYTIPRVSYRYANLAFIDSRVEDVLPDESWGDGVIVGDSYFNDNPTAVIATIDVSDKINRQSAHTNIQFDVLFNKDTEYSDIENPPYKPNIVHKGVAYSPTKSELQSDSFWRFYYDVPVNFEDYTIQVIQELVDVEIKNMQFKIYENMSYLYTNQALVGLFISESEYTNNNYSRFHWQPVPENGTLTDGNDYLHVTWLPENRPMIQKLIKPPEDIKRNVVYVHFKGQLPQITFSRYYAYLRSVIPAHLDFIITFGEPMENDLYVYGYSGTHVSVTAFK